MKGFTFRHDRISLMEMIDHLAEQAEQIVSEGREHTPMLLPLGQRDDGSVFVISVIGFQNPRENRVQFFAALARAVLIWADVVGYVSIMEAWTVRTRRPAPGETVEDVRNEHPHNLSEDPARQECIVMECTFIDGETLWVQYDIKRPSGEPIGEPVVGSWLLRSEEQVKYIPAEEPNNEISGVMFGWFKYIPKEVLANRHLMPEFDKAAEMIQVVLQKLGVRSESLRWRSHD